MLLGGDLPDGDLREDAIHAFFRPDGLPLILFPMRGHRWRLTVPFAGDRGEQAPTLAEIQHLTSQRAPRPVTLSDPTWLASFRCHRRSASACRRGRVLLAGDAVHIHSPAGGQGLNTGILDAHNLGWKLALVASGRAPDALLDTYGAERRPVAEEVLRLTHALVHYGTISHPVKRRIRDVVVPVLGRSAVIQRRAARRISQVYVSYPYAGPRMPDISVRADGLARPLHQVLRDGRPVLGFPQPARSPRWTDWRPTGTISSSSPPPAPGRSCWSGRTATWRRGAGPAVCTAVIGYLRGLFGEPGSVPAVVRPAPIPARRGNPWSVIPLDPEHHHVLHGLSDPRSRGRARTCMRSPCGPNRVSSSAGSAPAAPNQCGTRVSNSAASPGSMTKSCSASRSRSRPESTYIHS